MRAGQRKAAATALRNTGGGQEDKPIIFCPGLVEHVLGSISDPLVRGGRLAEQHSGLAPLESYEPACRFFEDLNLLDPTDDFRGVLDVGNRGPDRLLGPVDGDLDVNDHGMPSAVRVKVDP